MNNQNDSSALDLFRERLASPFLFTLFWVSCTWNWKLIYWFLYEPLKPSIKLVRIPFEWEVLFPVLITVVVICVVPWLNNVVEVIKQFAEHKLNLWLHTLNWKKMVTEAQYQELVDEVAQLKEKQHQLIKDNLEAQNNENQAKETLLSSQAEVNSKLKQLSELEEEKKSFISKLNEKSKRIDSLESGLNSANDKLEKIKLKSTESSKLLTDAKKGLSESEFKLANDLHTEFTEIIKLVEYHPSETLLQRLINREKANIK